MFNVLRRPAPATRTIRQATVAAMTALLVLASFGSYLPGVRAAAFPPEASTDRAVQPDAAPAPLASSQLAHRLSREVYGYLPYWEIDAGIDAYIRYDLMTDLALFSVGVTSSGAIASSQGYTAIQGSSVATIVQHAHAAGVRVDLTFTSFGLSKNAAFFSNAAAQANAITALAALVKAHGFDGVAVDVEALANLDFAQYGVFVGRLRAALRTSNPAARVSVATNGSLSGSGMAVQALANGADRVFIMGYSYRTSGTSPAGSIDPIVRADGGKSLSWTLDLYASKGIAADRILLGLPYYGRSWHTTSNALHAKTTSSAGVFIPGSEMDNIPSGTAVHTDALEGSKWVAVQNPTTKVWTETYYDDAATLQTKYSLAARRNLAGVGIWTLGYDRGITPFWNAIVGAFGTVRQAGVDRYGTASAIAAGAFGAGVPVAYVATGASFPDALAASAVAGGAKAPVLLVTATSIPAATLARLQALDPGRIIVVGGPSVVSDAVLAQLDKLAAGGAIRIAGSDRYSTAAAISASTFPTGAPVAYIASGSAFADAVSAAPAAARDGGPVLLTRPDLLPSAIRAELVRLAPGRIVIVGGTSVVSDAVASTIQALLPAASITRLAGADRYGTSAAVAATFDANTTRLYAASGLAFADALAAAAAAGAQGSPVLITAPTVLPTAIRAQIVRLAPYRAVVAGGTAAVSEAVLAAIRAAVAAS